MKKLPPKNHYLVDNKLLVSVLRSEGQEPVSTCMKPGDSEDLYLFTINETSTDVIEHFELASKGSNILFDINIEAVNNSLEELFYRTSCPDLYDMDDKDHVKQ